MVTLILRRRFERMALIGALLLALTAGLIYYLVTREEPHKPYRPTAAEEPMFGHLEHATHAESQQGRDVVTNKLELDPENPKLYSDVYVAKNNFRTVHTDHRMIVLMRPGVKWLGGPLGQIVLVLQEDPNTYDKDALKDVEEFGWANVLYDPFCYAYNLGAATNGACKSAVRQVSAKQVQLRPMHKAEYGPYWSDWSLTDIPTGDNLSRDYTTPTGKTTAFTWTEARSHKDTFYLPVTVLKRGQKLTGGELGSRYVFLPITKKVSAGGEYQDVRVVVSDPVRNMCRHDSVRPYLSDAVLAKRDCA